MKTLTKDDFGYDLTHRSGGNGFAVVDVYDDDPRYCRVTNVPPQGGACVNVWLAYVPFLERTRLQAVKDGPLLEQPLSDYAARKVAELREGLASGELVVDNQRVVPKAHAKR